MYSRFAALALFWLFLAPAQAQVRISGRVLDSENDHPIMGAHVVVEGSTLGSTTNAEGRFVVSVAALPVDLRIQHLGYESRSVRVESGDEVSAVRLSPAVLTLDELLVTGEDFAENVMRKVLAHKQAWRDEAWKADGYSRVTLLRGGIIVLLHETVYDAYRDPARGAMLVVQSRRTTANFLGQLGIPETGYLPDLYADDVMLHELRFIGPTHPRAFDHYVFRLAGRRKLDDQLVYDIYVSPKALVEPTFIGRISVIDETYAMVEADLRPARHVDFPPPVAGGRVALLQQFAPLEGGTGDDVPWRPVSLHLEGRIEMSADARRTRSIDIRQVTRLNGARRGAPPSGTESGFAPEGRVIVDETAVWDDPLFLRGRFVVPLTEPEAEALDRLDRVPMTLQQAFPPERRSGLLTAFIDEEGQPMWPILYGFQFRFRYNRVDGWMSSIGTTFEINPRLTVEARVGQASGLQRIRYAVDGRYGLGGHAYVAARTYRDVAVSQQGSRYSATMASLPARFGGADYFDYYWQQGSRIAAGFEPGAWRVEAGLVRETHESVERTAERAWPFHRRFTPNPPVDDGELFAVQASVEHRPDALYLFAELENSPGAFTRLRIEAAIRIATLARRRTASAGLTLRIAAAGGWGRLPVQRHTVLDGTLDLFALSRPGVFRALRERPYEGHHAAALFWEHDFRTLPFERLNLWPLVDTGTSLAVYGAHGRTWSGRPANWWEGVHHEVGVGLTRIGRTPLRVNTTYRLDRPAWTLGVGVEL